jgi:neuronal PAS domain-containing protein 1/3
MDVFEEHEGTHILQSMDGFAISLASDARFLYISETVSIYLGLSQVSSSTWVSHRSAHLRITRDLPFNSENSFQSVIFVL